MSLILNYIFINNDLCDSYQIIAADERIENTDGKFYRKMKKIIEISYLKSTISYFGLAVWNNFRQENMFDILTNFVKKNSHCNNLKEFCESLRKELNKLIPKNVLKQSASGFHISGYSEKGYPEFWHFSNIGKLEGGYYSDFKDQYNSPTSDFLERDAITKGWDGNDIKSIKNFAWVYRNGNIWAHVLSFEQIGSIMDNYFKLPDFKKVESPEEYAEYIRFQFKIAIYIYKKYSKKQYIGTPIDVYLLKHNQLKKI